MLSTISVLGRAALLTTILGASHRLLAQCALDPNVGLNLSLTDDSLSAAQPLGFVFPFAGANWDTVYVSSNGFLYLFDSAGSVAPPTSSQCCNGNSATLLSSVNPMVCGLWMDLNPSAGGSVHFNAVSPTKALITWLMVPEYANLTNLVDVQIALDSSGRIDIYTSSATVNAGHTALVGWSPGNGAADPGSSNLSSLPISAGTPTVYELFGTNGYDLGGLQISGVPTGPTSWLVVPGNGCALTSVYGDGCPTACDTLEEFPASTFDLAPNALQFTRQADGSYRVAQCTSNCFDTNFSNNLQLGDDQLAVGLSLGFPFPFCGGSTGTIDVCSNGFVWLVSGASTSADYSPTVAEFLSEPARLAPVWMDFNPSQGGGVYFDVQPGKALVTWDQVPTFGVTGSSNTLQLQLYPNGDFVYAWQSVTNNATTGNGVAIVGLSQGNVAVARELDLSASIPFQTGNGTPLTLSNQRGSRPVLGSTFNLEIAQIRTGSIGGSLIIGATNPNLDLSFLGLTGCRLLASLDVTLPIGLSLPVTTVPLPIPNALSLIGRSLDTQAVLVDPSLARTIPVYLSNGAMLTFGR